MSEQFFKLSPFPVGNPAVNFEIQGRIIRKLQTLEISYVIAGDRSDIIIPPLIDQPVRQHNLWEHTCFEFFLGLAGSDRYWEFNLSPAGHWNVYRFEGYRQGMQKEAAFTNLSFIVEEHSDQFALSIQLDLSAIALAERPLDVAITTVIEHQDHQISYWALAHTGQEADFHRRDSFTIKV